MEQVLYFGFTLAFGAVMFLLGQKSVRLVGQRLETQHPSDRRTVSEWSASQPGKVFYEPQDAPSETSVVVPPRYRHLVSRYKEGEE